MTFAFDWLSIEERLFEESRAIITQFSTEYPDLICSFFAYDIDLDAGYSLPSFDTREHSLLVAQRQEQKAIDRRRRTLTQEWSWRSAKSFSNIPCVTDFGSDAGYFAYPIYAEWSFPQLCALRESNLSPKRNHDLEDDYIEGKVRLVLWKVIERLIEHEAFHPLLLASPFRIGYQFHDEELVVLRIINWPSVL